MHIKCFDDPKIVIKNSLQLPQCPLCMERLDVTVSGLSTLTSSDIISYIYSHNSKNWNECEKICKVCKILNSSPSDKSLVCYCGIKESIWACLICGYIGCGRYQNAHAVIHFKETNHIFAVDIESGRIWDYLEDKYVHRILKNSASATIEPDMDSFLTPGNPEELTEKIENTLREYNHLLTAQLEDQRNYFEAKLKKCKKVFEETEEMKAIKGKLDSLNATLSEAKAHKKKLAKENGTLEKQNDTLNEKINDTEKFLILNAATKDNLLKEIADLEKFQNEELKQPKEDPKILKKQKIIEELEKEIASLYEVIQ